MPRQVQNQKTRNDGIVNVDESNSNARRYQRRRYPASALSACGRLILFLNARQHCERDERGDDLHQCRALERAEPVTHHRSRRNSTPNAATQIPERLRAAVNTSEFYRPGRGTRVEAGLADTLENTPDKRRRN